MANNFTADWHDQRHLLGAFEYSLDVLPTPYELSTPLYAGLDPALMGTMVHRYTGRRLLKLKAQGGSQVFIRNAKLEYLEDDMIQITFHRREQTDSGPPQPRAAPVEQPVVQCADDADPWEEDPPVFILWESGSIEQCENEDEAKTLLMEMGSRGGSGQIFQSQEDASEALKAHALVYNKKHAT